MELRTLRYFLALAQEGTVSNAAKALHVTQPTLSRQLADLEKGFGKQLFERGAKRIVLTDEGVRLREYAEAIVELADKAEAELAQPERAVAGDVYVGCGESDAMRIILRAAKRARDEHPGIRFHLFSGTSADLMDRFNEGLFDFMVEFEAVSRPDCLSCRCPCSTPGACSCARIPPWRISPPCAPTTWPRIPSSARARRSRRASCRRGRARRSIPGTW